MIFFIIGIIAFYIYQKYPKQKWLLFWLLVAVSVWSRI